MKMMCEKWGNCLFQHKFVVKRLLHVIAVENDAVNSVVLWFFYISK